MAILEALHARRPVITSNVGGMAELVRDGDNGLTFPVGDAVALAGHLRRLAADRRALAALQPAPDSVPTAGETALRIEAAYAALLGERG
jgi:glycosyltransferase involved in cell wall biosynthesis